MKKVIKININLYLILIIELCCFCCIYKNVHKGHKILEISDEEAIKKENITLESINKENDDMIQKIMELKKKTENEINKINELFEKLLMI